MHTFGRPETRLMILAAREQCGDATLDAMSAVAPKCQDLDSFIWNCLGTKTYPLVLSSLRTFDGRASNAFVAEALPLLERAYHDYWSDRGLRVMKILRRIRQAFSAARIPFITLKGIPLARSYYRNPACRVCADVDVMIRKEHVDSALIALDEIGIHPMYAPALHHAKMKYADKAELIHGRSRIQVDVSWSEMGNAGIGRVSRDSFELWSRAKQVAPLEWRLSPEDDILMLVRHVGHGHDFDHALLQCCADVAAIMRKCASSLDWDYIERAAYDAEFLRVCQLFAHFYDVSYRDTDMLTLSERFSIRHRTATRADCRLFSRMILTPLLERRIRSRPLADIVYGNLCFAAKFWALDRKRRLCRLLVLGLHPSRDELIQLTEHHNVRSLMKRIIYYYGVVLPAALPAIIYGTIMRLLSDVILVRTHGTQQTRSRQYR